MECPKCLAEQDAGNSICVRCGLVFEKYYKYHPRPGAAAVPLTPARRFAPAAPSSLGELLFPSVLGTWPQFIGRALVLAVLLVWGASLALSSVAGNAAGSSFMHLINLPFHEAGHLLFRPLGQFMSSLGGTLGQLLMPAVCTLVLLLKTRDPFGASVGLWWFGQNFIDIAPYINDARAGQLPLLGGNTGQSAPYGFHDWQYLLGETGLLHLDHKLAVASHFLGAVIILLALVWGGTLIYRQSRLLKERLLS